MQRKHQITEKQLAFLDQYLKKYSFGSEDDKVELKDHLILDFEENGNGNLSQYLSDKIGFIKKFIASKLNAIHKRYRRKTIDEAIGFFRSIQKLSLTIIVFLCMYTMTHFLNETLLIVLFISSVLGLFVYSQFFLKIKKEDKKKLDRIDYLGQEMWWPYLMLMLPLPYYDELIVYKTFFSLYWFVAVGYSIAAILVMKKEKKLIYEKYKHLLD